MHSCFPAAILTKKNLLLFFRSVVKVRAKFDPRVVSKYDVKALIGRGSFSRVVRVEHKGTKQQYAIKMIDVSEHPCGTFFV